jgi:hypothetical protein
MAFVDASASVALGVVLAADSNCAAWGCDGTVVVPGIDNGGRVELYVSADEGMSKSVGVRWRSCTADQSANDTHRGFSVRQIPKTLVSRGGRDARVAPNAFVTSCSCWAATSKTSRIQRFSRSRPPSAGAGASSACACANVRAFFPLLDAGSTSTSSSALPHHHLLFQGQHRTATASPTRGQVVVGEERACRCW